MTKHRKTRRKKEMTHQRPMSAEAMRSWRQSLGLSERDAAKRLGMARSTLRIAEQHGAPLYVGLACAALSAGINPIL